VGRRADEVDAELTALSFPLPFLLPLLQEAGRRELENRQVHDRRNSREYSILRLYESCSSSSTLCVKKVFHMLPAFTPDGV
jgi:hypothetical protein